MMSTAWWPSCWNRRSFRSGTVWPRWTLMPVGSMPNLTRRGMPCVRLRVSFSRSCSSGTICSTPRRIKASWCSTFSCTSRLTWGVSSAAIGTLDHLAAELARRGRHHSARAEHARRPNPSTVHLKAPDGGEGVPVMDNRGLALVRRPADREHVEAGGAVEQAVPLQKGEGQVREAALLDGVNGGSRPFGVASL